VVARADHRPISQAAGAQGKFDSQLAHMFPVETMLAKLSGGKPNSLGIVIPGMSIAS
jgi:hypothetical protein